MLKKLVLLPIVQSILVLSVILTPNSVNACSCVSQTVEEAVSSSDAIFEGRVLEVGTSANEDSESALINMVRMRVVRSWKGVTEEQLILRTANNEAGCGYPFRVNQSYLVYANSSRAGLRAGLCSRTKPIDNAEHDLDVLGMGEVPVSARLTPDEKRIVQTPKPPPSRAGCASCEVIAAQDAGTETLGLWLTLLVFCLAHKRSENRRGFKADSRNGSTRMSNRINRY